MEPVQLPIPPPPCSRPYCVLSKADRLICIRLVSINTIKLLVTLNAGLTNQVISGLCAYMNVQYVCDCVFVASEADVVITQIRSGGVCNPGVTENSVGL